MSDSGSVGIRRLFRFIIVGVAVVCAVPVWSQGSNDRDLTEDADKVWSWWQMGTQAYSQRDYEAAERNWRLCWQTEYQRLGSEEENQEWLIAHGVNVVKSLIAQRKIDDAATFLSQLESVVPKLKSPLENKNRLLLAFWQARLLQIQGAAEQAVPLFDEIAGETNGDIGLRRDATLRLGECRIALQQWDVAEDLLKQVVAEVTPDEVDERNDAWRGLIRVNLARKNYDQAYRQIFEQLEHAKGWHRRELNLMQVHALLGMGKSELAYKIFQDELSELAENASHAAYYPVVRALAAALSESNNYDGAIAILTQALRLVAGDERKQVLLLELADVSVLSGDTEKAIGHFARFLALYSRDARTASVRMRLGALHEDRDEFKLAMEYYSAVYSNTDYPALVRFDAAQRLGWISRDQFDDYDKAITYFVDAEKLPVNANLRALTIYNAADCSFATNDFKSAVIRYQTVADDYPASDKACPARYGQAVSQLRAERYRLAADVFEQVVNDCKDEELLGNAMIEKGLALKRAGDFTPALVAYQRFVTRYPEHDRTPEVLLAASEAAVAAGNPQDGIRLLSDVVERYSTSDSFPYALYKRAYLNFAYGYVDDAKRDSLLFDERFSKTHRDLTPDVYLWLGDHFVRHQDYEQAAAWFLKVYNDFPNSKDAPMALYEAAKNAYNWSQHDNRGFEDALHYIELLESKYAGKAHARELAKAKFLSGDIASFNGDYETAAKRFDECREAVPGTELYYAALGRLGECYYSMGSTSEDGQAYYQKALNHFNEIIGSTGINEAFLEMARFRAGYIYELLGKSDLAKAAYQDIFYSYDIEANTNRVNDLLYFARAGDRLARLHQSEAKYDIAIVIYERLAQSGVPIAEDARRKAQELKASWEKLGTDP